jgi:sulfur dioxygenase
MRKAYAKKELLFRQ